MTPSQTPELETPLIADSAPRLDLLVQGSKTAEQLIPCRHIVTLLGARQGCKVVLPHRKVSPVHLAVVHTGPQIYAVDLVSHEGTQLNGLKMLFDRLANDDVLKVGPWTFHVKIQGPERNGDADAHPFALEPTPNVVALEHMASRRVLRLDREVCLIGRRSGCDINVADHTMSRAHAMIFTYYGYPVIVDLLSRNQTFVNDQPVVFQVLKTDDTLTIGETRFRVRLLGSRTVERLAKEVESSAGPIRIVQDATGPDLIDIKATEGSQRWHIADSLEKAV